MGKKTEIGSKNGNQAPQPAASAPPVVLRQLTTSAPSGSQKEAATVSLKVPEASKSYPESPKAASASPKLQTPIRHSYSAPDKAVNGSSPASVAMSAAADEVLGSNTPAVAKEPVRKQPGSDPKRLHVAGGGTPGMEEVLGPMQDHLVPAAGNPGPDTTGNTDKPQAETISAAGTAAIAEKQPPQVQQQCDEQQTRDVQTPDQRKQESLIEEQIQQEVQEPEPAPPAPPRLQAPQEDKPQLQLQQEPETKARASQEQQREERQPLEQEGEYQQPPDVPVQPVTVPAKPLQVPPAEPSLEQLQNGVKPGQARDSTPPAAALAPPILPVPSLPSDILPAVNTITELTPEHLSVLGAWYSLYRPQKEAQQAAALAKHYDERARFEDNFVQVIGRDQIGVMYYVMHRAVKGITMAIEKIEVLPGDRRGTYQIRIIGKHAFHLPALIRGPVTSLFLPEALVAWATDTLTVREADHKILHHQQRVHNIPTIWWPARWSLGLSLGLFAMHVLGW